jgi:hypothetical protein
MKAISNETYDRRGRHETEQDLYQLMYQWIGKPIDQNSIEFKQLVLDALSYLQHPKRMTQYEVVYMHYFLGISIIQIGYTLLKTPYSVEKSLNRGLNNMEKFVRDKYENF